MTEVKTTSEFQQQVRVEVEVERCLVDVDSDPKPRTHEKAQHRRSEGGRRKSSILPRSSGANGLSEEGADLFRFLANCDDSFVSAESSSDQFHSVPASPQQFRLDDSELVECSESVLDEDYCNFDGIDGGQCANFHLPSDDSDNGADSDPEYEGGWFPDVLDNLDPQKLVEAVKNGASMEELISVAEAEMAELMEHHGERLLNIGNGSRSGSVSPIKAGDMSSQAIHSEQASPSGVVEGRTLSELGGLSGRMTPALATGSLSGRMTPALAAGSLSGHMTPRRSSGLAPPPAAGSTFVEEVTCKLQASCEKQVATRARRSSAMMHSSIHKAFRRLSLQHQHTLKTEEDREIANGEDRSRLRQSIAGAKKNHRKSILKAAEVLEAAGIGVETADGSTDGADDALVAEQLEKVQRALEGAQRRHRKSILCAVKKVTGKASEACDEDDDTEELETVAPETAESKPSSGLPLPRARVEQIVAQVYARRQQEKAQGIATSGTKKRIKNPIADLGNPRALLNTRVETDSSVHCGPARRPRARR